MRIALKVGETYHWLAGEPEVSPRTHSWAADFQLSPQSVVQIAQFVRGAHAKPIDRGNLLQEVRFTTTRQFANPAEALLWCLDYDGAFPRSGELIFEAIAPNGGVTRRKMLTTVVDPPSRRIIGATALVDYTVKGGAVEPMTSPDMAVSGTLTSNGSTTVVFANLIYAGLINSKAAYTDNGLLTGYTQSVQWFYSMFGSYWYLAGPTYGWVSTEDVATPDLVTTWAPGSAETGTPVVTPI
jgi:hypothetical protein